jgi:adenosylhomocysteine nucleosidase
MIAIAFALEFESAFFRAKHDSRLRVAIWLLGAMGPHAANKLEQRLTQNTPKLVISAGFGGGLQPEIQVGDLVIGQNFSDPGIVSRLNLGEGWRVGDVITEDAIIERSADKIRLGESTGALAGDLETAHFARVCAARGIPMLSVRCISDGLLDSMPVPANLLLNPETGRPEPLQLFRHLLTNPSAVGGFNKLLKNAKIAQTRLAAGLDELLPQLLRLK